MITDHKPLTAIFGPRKGIPTLVAAWLQRWAIMLSAYSYDVIFRPTGEHSNADMLSHLPVDKFADVCDTSDTTAGDTRLPKECNC